MNRKLLNIALDHAFFQRRDELLVRMEVAAESRRLAQNYGLIVKFRSNQIQVYAVDGFDADSIGDSGPLWIYLDFLTENVMNVTGADITPDKQMLFFECTGTRLQGDDVRSFEMDLSKTLNDLIDAFDTFGIESCEPDELRLPEGSLWEDTLDEFIKAAADHRIDEGKIELTGGKAEGVYLNVYHGRWVYPDAALQITPDCLSRSASLEKAPDVHLKIRNRGVYWCYYLVNKKEKEIDASGMSIISNGSGITQERDLPLFEQIDTVDFSGYEKAIRFCSKEPVSLQNRYPFTIELKGYSNSEKPVILPYPEVNVLSSIERSGKVELSSNIYLYL